MFNSGHFPTDNDDNKTNQLKRIQTEESFTVGTRIDNNDRLTMN